MSIIYLRHAPKEHANMKGKHDPPIDASQLKDMQKRAAELIKVYGVPDLLVVSPYLRARQTAKLITNAITELQDEKVSAPHIVVDVNVSEYLGHRMTAREYRQGLDKDTLEYGPRYNESMNDIVDRMTEHEKNILYFSNYKNIWVITHGIVMGAHSKSIYSMSVASKNYPNLGGFRISGDKVTPV